MRFAVIVAVAVILGGCSIFFENLTPKAIALEDIVFTLEWDPPARRRIEPGKEPVSYRLHYRGTDGAAPADWELIAEVAASEEPSYTVSGAVFATGRYIFAVSSVDASDTESEYHQSIDSDARPRRGWILEIE